jgi:hypothetical protein
MNLFVYAAGVPTAFADSEGLRVELYCHFVGAGGGLGPFDVAGILGAKHCFVRAKCSCSEGKSYDRRLELTGHVGSKGEFRDEDHEGNNFNTKGHLSSLVPFMPPDSSDDDCTTEDCLVAKYKDFKANGYIYGREPTGYSGFLAGPNSNTFAHDLLKSCGVETIYWPRGVPPFTGQFWIPGLGVTP